VTARLNVCVSALLWLTVSTILPVRAEAQTGRHDIGIRGFADVGGEAFTASDSFKAILGTASGIVFGGGGDVLLPKGLFVELRASRFQKNGERVFVSGGETFGLGIDTKISVTPIELTGGYRFGRADARIVPYGGGGVGWHHYKETSEFATDAENVDATHTGYHILGGAEVRIMRWLSAAGEAQWTTVRDALGQDPNAVSTAFDETDLGGTTFRVKIIIGR
jgi:opacity protein-like surface antigen